MSFWSRRDGSCFLICFTIAMGVYLYSLPQSITLEDAGELVVAADYLGVPHPPGYPLWTFLAWFFQWIFNAVEFRGYPNPAWPVALMSAFFGSLSCGLVAVCIRKLIAHLPGSPDTQPSPLHSSLKAEALGSLTGLGIFSVVGLLPDLGFVLLASFSFLFLLIVLLQSFTTEPRRFSWQKRFPHPAKLGAGFLGFLYAFICWTTAWYWLMDPQLSFIFPLALTGLLGLYVILFLLRTALQKAFGKANLSRDIQRSGMDILMAGAGGLLLAFSPLMWSQSVIVEVYSLNAFFLSALLVLVLWYIQDPQDKILYYAAFLFALGLTNHQSLLFLVFFLVAGVAAAKNLPLLKDGLFLIGLGALLFCILKAVQYHSLEDPDATRFFLLLTIPVVLYLVTLVLTRGGLFTRWKQLVTLVGLGILGLSFHLYMPLASEQNPPMNWANTRTPEGFWHSLGRGQYAKFSVADNIKQIAETVTPSPPDLTEGEPSQKELNHRYIRRTLFLRMLGSYFYDATWKYSIANQFSWQFPLAEADPTGILPPPQERQLPLALIGLLPLLCFAVFAPAQRGWFISSLIAMFFVSVVFLTIQWPELNQNDLWIKRVQYVQAHVLFAVWMALGASVLIFYLYALLPNRFTLGVSSILFCGLYILFPLHKDATDPRHLAQLGGSNLHGYDFGWQYGFYQLKGANGILLDELSHHTDPDTLLDEWAISYLETRDFPSPELNQLRETHSGKRMPLSTFWKTLDKDWTLHKTHKRLLEQALTLAAFRALTPEQQSEALVYLPEVLPNWDYPPEMDQEGILFGGTDPGRFVPTYMIFSAECRTDLFIITQTALADATYQTVTRDIYGDRIFLPDLVDGNVAFLDYGNHLRLFNPEAFARLMGSGEMLSLSGVNQVNEINSLLTKRIFEQNQHAHSFYFEEALQIEWMIPHLRPHGLVFKIEAEPYTLTFEDIQQDFAFWDWYEAWLLRPHPREGKRNRYQRDLPVQKSFSKLRMAQAWNYYERGHWIEAEKAMEQSQRLYPANPEAALRAVDMYMRMRKFDRAEEILEAFAKHDPTNRQLRPFATSLNQRRELDEQRKELERDFSLHITGNLTLQLMQIYGQLEMKKQMFEKADVLLRLPNLHTDFYIHLAAFMQQEENLEYYKKAVEKWSEKAPGDARPHFDLAAMAMAEENYTEMINQFVRAIQIAPKKSRAQLASDPRFIDIHHWTQFQRLITPPSL